MERAAQLDELTPIAWRERRVSLRNVEKYKLEQQHTQQAHADGDATRDDVRDAKARMWMVMVNGLRAGTRRSEGDRG